MNLAPTELCDSPIARTARDKRDWYRYPTSVVPSNFLQEDFGPGIVSEEDSAKATRATERTTSFEHQRPTENLGQSSAAGSQPNVPCCVEQTSFMADEGQNRFF